MKEEMTRRTASGLISSKGGSILAFREEKVNNGTIKYCSRPRCSASLHSIKETQRGRPGSGNNLKPSLPSGSSSKLFSTNHRRPCLEKQFQEQHIENPEQMTANPQTIDDQGWDFGAVNVEHNSIHGCRLEENKRSNLPPESSEFKSLQGFSESGNEHRASSSTSSSRSSSKQVITQHKQNHQKSMPSRTRYLAGSGISSPSPANSGLNRRLDTIRKRYSSGETLSARELRTAGLVSGGTVGSSDGVSPSSITSRNLLSSRSFLSVRTRRAAGRDARTNIDDSISSSNNVTTAQPTPDELLSVPETSSGLQSRVAPRSSNTNGQPKLRNRTVPGRSISQISCPPLPRRDNYPARVAEMLMQLQRLEQYEYEQFLTQGSDVSRDSLHDQHRDMRMDIDDMSYEELLALGERIGSVSTALSEEVISKCLKRNNYLPSCLVLGDNDNKEDDTKCSICQEEYVLGEELGELACQHCYHMTCIHQWLRLKNWCPICKTSVSPTC